ncbi:UNVERIFIED_CONTAM: hypothetical protein FKN15_010096 [Acipenser sinensis]
MGEMDINDASLVIVAHPTRGLVDEKFHVDVLNLRPHQPITLHSVFQSEENDFWEAYGHYISDSKGMVKGPGPFPGILDLWGGGGGLVEYRSALLASHGYASLALEYLFQKNTSEKSAVIGEQYFEAAFNILKNHPKVASERVGLFGLSFGTSVALAMAGNSTTVSPKCLVCVSGSHVFPVKESLSGVFAEMKTNLNKLKVDENNHLIWRNLILPIPTDPDKKVKIENMMKKAGNDHLLTKLSYPGTGHLIETPYSPHTRFSNFMLADSREKGIAQSLHKQAPAQFRPVAPNNGIPRTSRRHCSPDQCMKTGKSNWLPSSGHLQQCSIRQSQALREKCASLVREVGCYYMTGRNKGGNSKTAVKNLNIPPTFRIGGKKAESCFNDRGR